MTNLLYNPATEAITRYPRADDSPIVGLDPALVVLTEIIQNRPDHDPETQYLEQTREIDTDAGTLTRGWTIRDKPPEPRWIDYGNAVMANPAVNIMLGAAIQSAPALYGGLTVGLGKAADGDGRVFLGSWATAVALGLVSAELIAEMTTLAVAHDLPDEFVAALTP